MKICNDSFKFLGLLMKTVEKLSFDQTSAIVDDEFNRNRSLINGEDYRTYAIRKLVALCIPWRTECNIAFDVVKKFVSVHCPYCKKVMITQGMSGSGSSQTTGFLCEKCGATASMEYNPENFLSFKPNEKAMEDAKNLL